MFERDKSYIFLVAFSLEALFVHRSNVVLSKMIRKLHHSQKKEHSSMSSICKMACSWSLDNIFEVVKGLVIQSKKWMFNNICLTIVDMSKDCSNSLGKTFPSLLEFKVMNVLNQLWERERERDHMHHKKYIQLKLTQVNKIWITLILIRYRVMQWVCCITYPCF